jgi:hypothetical protein
VQDRLERISAGAKDIYERDALLSSSAMAFCTIYSRRRMRVYMHHLGDRDRGRET